MTPDKRIRVSIIGMVVIAVCMTLTAAAELWFGQRTMAVLDLAIVVGNLCAQALVMMRWKSFESKEALRTAKLEILKTNLSQAENDRDMSKEMLKRVKAGQVEMRMGIVPDDDDAPRH